MRYDGHSELLKAAPKRLRDALELLEEPTREPDSSDAAYRHLCGACYLAGYAVECILKVYVIRLLDYRRGPGFVRWSDVVEHFATMPDGPDLSGARSHSLRRLLAVSGLESELGTDPGMRANWTQCERWDYAWRYVSAFQMSPVGARRFVEACRQTHDWIKHRLP